MSWSCFLRPNEVVSAGLPRDLPYTRTRVWDAVSLSRLLHWQMSSASSLFLLNPIVVWVPLPSFYMSIQHRDKVWPLVHMWPFVVCATTSRHCNVYDVQMYKRRVRTRKSAEPPHKKDLLFHFWI